MTRALLDRRALLRLATLGGLAALAPRAHAQTAGAVRTRPLARLDEATFAALRPLAERGVAVLVREPEGGVDAQITVLARARAPLATVYDVIARPEDYASFMNGITRMEVLSRVNRRVGFRFHVSVAVFEVTTLASLHLVNPRRVDGELLQSDLGPGGLRWELFADGPDATYVAYSTWGDPSQANWLLRTLAQVSPGAIAAMQLGYDALLVLSAARRAEALAGRAGPARPAVRVAPAQPLEAPTPGPWTALTRDGSVVGAITLDAQGSLAQVTVARRSELSVDALRARLARVDQYPRVWPAVREARALASAGPSASASANTDDAPQRARLVVETPLFRTAGTIERVLERTAHGSAVRWRGLDGDYERDEQRFDLWPEGSGALVAMTGPGSGDERRAGMIARAIIDRDPWMLPGYGAAWKLVWLGHLIRSAP